MRLMDRDKRDMWLSRFGDRVELVDGDGFGTGEYRTPLSEPVRFRGNWAPPTGLASYAPFGTQVSYDVAVVLDDNDLGIREGDVVWLSEPAVGEDGQPDRNGAYRVTRVASLWDAFAFALKSMGGA